MKSDFNLGVTELMGVLVPGLLTAAAILEVAGNSNFARIEGAFDVLLLIAMAFVLGLAAIAVGRVWDRVYNFLHDNQDDPYTEAVGKIRGVGAGEPGVPEIDNYQWCRAWLMSKHPAAFQEVARCEVESKLFRSILLPLIFWSIYLGNDYREEIAAVGAVLALVSYWRFQSQRRQARVLASTHLITLESAPK
jgi:hypothetical protein